MSHPSIMYSTPRLAGAPAGCAEPVNAACRRGGDGERYRRQFGWGEPGVDASKTGSSDPCAPHCQRVTGMLPLRSDDRCDARSNPRDIAAVRLRLRRTPTSTAPRHSPVIKGYTIQLKRLLETFLKKKATRNAARGPHVSD